MSRNSLRSIWWLLVLMVPLWSASISVSSDDNNNSLAEDALIMQAIMAENDSDYDTSRSVFDKLFELTGNKEYLIREANDALMQNKNLQASIQKLTDWVTKHPIDHDPNLYLVLAALYANSGALRDADEIIDAYLVRDNNDPEDLVEFAGIKVKLGEYEEAIKLYKRAYEITQDEDIVSQIVAIYALKLKRNNKAIEILERHIRDHASATVGIYFMLIELYAKEDQADKVLKIYKELYRKDPQKYFLQKIIELSTYLKDKDGLISFLESTHGNSKLLYDAYKVNKLYDKAIVLLKQMYQETKQPQWLAEQAIMTYEKSQADHNTTKALLDQVSRMFDKAISQGVHKSMYLNYYGYILIDHDVDVDKGIKLIRKALSHNPNNPYYLDSLAWGLYKKGSCQKARKLILKVVQSLGTKETEVNDHNRAIKACK